MLHKSTMDWSDVAVFLTTVNAGSARATAQKLNISHSTVSRRIANLEASLGVNLFKKNVSGYQLTEDGKKLLHYARLAEQPLITAEQQLQGKDAKFSGEIRITAPDAIINHLLMPTIARFKKLYPNIDVEVVLSSNVLDLADSDIDLALRIMPIAQLPPNHLIGRIISKLAMCYYATPEYLKIHDPWQENTQAAIIGWGEYGKTYRELNDSPLSHLQYTCRMNHSAMQVSAAYQGIGIAALPCFIGDSEPGLIRVDKCLPEIKHDLWLITNPSQRDITRVKAFKDTLLADFLSLNHCLLGT